MRFGVTVAGDRKVGLKFDEFPQQLHDALLTRITVLSAELEGRILALVPFKTGKLKAEVERFVDDHDTRIKGSVKVVASDRNALLKAIALEYGSHRRIDVALRSRLNGDSIIGAYSRTTNLAAREFLRGPLREMAARVVSELRAAVDEAASA
jgi:hypothetical protein